MRNGDHLARVTCPKQGPWSDSGDTILNIASLGTNPNQGRHNHLASPLPPPKTTKAPANAKASGGGQGRT